MDDTCPQMNTKLYMNILFT